MHRQLVRSNAIQQHRPTFTVELTESKGMHVVVTPSKVDVSYTFNYNRHLIPNDDNNADVLYKALSIEKG